MGAKKTRPEGRKSLTPLSFSTSKSEFFKYLVEQIKTHKLDLFLGAGISKNNPSNLPLASEFKKTIMEELCFTEGINEIYEASEKTLTELPFESFVKLLMTDSNFFDYLLSIFSSGKPNKNHHLIAKLIARELISEILTTNLDTLLEQGTEPLCEDTKSLSVLLEEKQFQQVNFQDMKIPVLFKIHGSVQNPSSIRITLDLISSKILAKDRTRVLDHFFKRSERNLLILGYSCSDDFDINPYLRNLTSETTVLFVKHSDNDFRIVPLVDPLCTLSGYQINCNTNELIDYLWEEFCDSEFRSIDFAERKWVNDVHKWNSELTSALRCYLVSKVLLELRRVDTSISLFEKGLSKNPAKRLRAHMLARLATAQNLKGEFEESFRKYKESLALLEEGIDDLKIAEVYHFLGMIEKLRGNYSASEEHLLRSRNIAEKMGSKLGVSIATAELGTLYQRRGDMPKAKELYEGALAIAQEIGHLTGIAVCLHHLGTIARKKKDIPRAEVLFREELDLRKKLGDKQGIAGAKHELGLCAEDKGKLDDAQTLLEQAKDLLESIPDNARIAWTLHDLGTVHYLKGNFRLAEDLTQKSMDIKREKNDLKGIAIGLGQLGVIRFRQGKKEEAEELFYQAYQIAKKLPDEEVVRKTMYYLKLLGSKRI